MNYLTGKDYEHLCPVCQAAVDQAHVLILEDYDDKYADDPEGPCNLAYDNGWFCGGHECVNRVEPPPTVRYVVTLVKWSGKSAKLMPISRLDNAIVTYNSVYALRQTLNHIAERVWGDYHEGWTWASNGYILQQIPFGFDEDWTEMIIRPEYRCPKCKKWDCICGKLDALRRKEVADGLRLYHS